MGGERGGEMQRRWRAEVVNVSAGRCVSEGRRDGAGVETEGGK